MNDGRAAARARTPLVWGALLGGASVALGAFAAHALRPHLSPEALTWVGTAARLTGLHAVALVGVAAVSDRLEGACVRAVTLLFVAGTFLFAGSLVALALSEWAAGEPKRWLGAITPLGGVSFLLGWARLAVEAWRLR